jgi:alpha-1,6-mannosyltransferase
MIANDPEPQSGSGGSSSIKLLDITEFFSPLGGGVRTYLRSKARWLSEHTAIEHTIVLPSDRNTTEKWYESRVYYVAGAPVPASPGYYFLTALAEIRTVFERERPDVVEIGSPFLAPWVVRRAARAAKPAFVGYYHCDVPSVYVSYGLRRFPAPFQHLARTMLRRYLAMVYGQMQHMVAATPSADAALRSLGLKAVSTIPLGVDTELFCPERRDPTWRSEVGASATDPVALYVGRFAGEKALDVVVEALPDLVAATGLKLVLIGEGHMRESLRQLSRELMGHLILLPYETDRDKLARAYASSDLYIAPFPYETFGLSAVEAMACGTPVVGADSGGLKDLLEDSRYGRLFKPGDAGSLEEAVVSVLKEDPNDLGVRTRKAVEERYSWDRTFGAMVDLYERLASGRRKTKGTEDFATVLGSLPRRE